MSKVKIDCNITIEANTIEEAAERLLKELATVTAAATAPTGDTDAIVTDYHNWNIENEGDVDWCAHYHKDRDGDDWMVESTINVRNLRFGSPRA